MTTSRRASIIGALLAALALVVGVAAPAAATPVYSISGHVFLGDTDHPATTGDASVEFTLVGSSHRPEDSVPVAADGSYVISGLAPGSYHLFFRYLGTGPYSSTYWGEDPVVTDPVQVTSITSADVTASWTLPTLGEISGHVALGTAAQSAGSGEVAVSYRVIHAGNTFSTESDPVLTDASGNFVLPDIAQGTSYEVHFVYQGSGGFQSGWYGSGGSLTTGSSATQMYAGGVYGNKDASITLPPFSTISGHIFLGTTATPAGPGVVSVSLTTVSSVLVAGPVGTDSNGAYSFGGLSDGQYQVVVTYSQDQHFATTTTSASASLSQGSSATIDVTIPPRYSITGHVDDRPGHSASAGEITAALVTGVGTLVATTVTDASGNYRFDQFAGGQVTVVYTYTDSPGGRQYGDTSHTVDVTSDTAVASVVMAPRTWLSGHVAAADGQPLAGVAMSAFEYDSGTGAYIQTFSTTTDTDGAYSFSHLPLNAYGIEAHDPAQHYATMEYDNASPYYVPDYLPADGAFDDGLDFVLPVAAHITGSVQGAPSSDLAGGHVSAEVEVLDYSGDTPVWFETGDVWPVAADGTFDVGDLPPDGYRLKFSDSGSPTCPSVVTPVISLGTGATAHQSVTLSCRSSDQQYVVALYHDFLGRAPSTDDLNYWTGRLAAGAPRSSIANGFITSDEYRLIRIDAAYQTILGRAPDPDGRLWWLNQMRSGAISVDAISIQFYASDEYVQAAQHWAPTGDHSLDWVLQVNNWVYQVYVDLLHRAPDASGMTYWTIQAEIRGRQSVVSTFWNESETAGARVSAMYASYLGRTPDAGGLAYWTSVDIAAGDTPTRDTITSSQEYYNRAQTRVF